MAENTREGGQVRVLRQAVDGRPVSQGQLAEAMGLHLSTVVDIEKGRLRQHIGRHGWAALKRSVEAAVAGIVGKR